ncbi:hypothetical protein RSAG8_11279, partial [Rhizoctonia solani AG-8 WAC10335]
MAHTSIWICVTLHYLLNSLSICSIFKWPGIGVDVHTTYMLPTLSPHDLIKIGTISGTPSDEDPMIS